jgi:PAS domain S-box-containing protein
MTAVGERKETLVHRLDAATQEILQLQAKLDCVAATVVGLDHRGHISYVNEAWHRFAHDNEADAATQRGVGLDYLAVCDHDGAPSALTASQGIRAILAAEADSFDLEYRCHSPERRRWFRMAARRTAERDVAVVLTHLDITALHLAETRSQIQASVTHAFATGKSLLESCRDLALVTCEKLEWDYMAIWTLDAAAWTLRCTDSWVRPGHALNDFEHATRSARLGPGTGLPGRAWTNRAGVWVTDRGVDPTLVGSGPNGAWMIMPLAARGVGLRSGFAFPLKCDGDVLAVVEVYARIREEPDPALLHILEISGAQIALAELRNRAERRAAAAQAEADGARESLEAVLDCAPALVVSVDRDGMIQFLNRAPPALKKEDAIGRDLTEFVTQADRAKLRAALQTVLEGGEPHTFDTSVPIPGGALMCFANYVGPMHSGGKITGAVLIAQDVTEFRRTAAELFESQRLASIGTLAAGVAHEINTPLQFIGDNLEFLRDATSSLLDRVLPTLQQVCKTLEGQPLEADTRDALAAAETAQARADLVYLRENVPSALELCTDGLQRVTTIVRSLKEFSHPAQENMVAVDLNRSIAATLTVARNEYKYVAELETEFGELPAVVCHVNQINQAILNIVINASHALADKHHGTDHKGTIRVQTLREGDAVVIAIRDTADGIPEHIRGRIFDPFFTTKDVGRGTGQGLAIAWNSIKKVHAGELTFTSTMGQGTEFFIRLPIQGAG